MTGLITGGAVTYPLGPEGGTLAVSGVSIVFPANALTSTLPYTLTVTTDETGVTLNVEPDIDLTVPATVTINYPAFPIDGPVEVFHILDGGLGEEQFLLAEPQSNNHTVTYQTSAFSKESANAKKSCPVLPSGTSDCRSGNLVKTCDAGWSLCDRTAICAQPNVSYVADLDKALVMAIQVAAGPTAGLSGTCLTNLTGQTTRFTNRYEMPPRSFTKFRNPLENVLMAPEAAQAIQAADVIFSQLPSGINKSPSGGYYRLYINGALDTTGWVHANPHDPHVVGAAVDIGVTDCGKCDQCGNCTNCARVAPPASVLADVAKAAMQAGFAWVFYEDRNHVHAAVISASCGAGPGPQQKGAPMTPSCGAPTSCVLSCGPPVVNASGSTCAVSCCGVCPDPARPGTLPGHIVTGSLMVPADASKSFAANQACTIDGMDALDTSVGQAISGPTCANPPTLQTYSSFYSFAVFQCQQCPNNCLQDNDCCSANCVLPVGGGVGVCGN